MVKITSSNPRKIAYLKSVYSVPKSNISGKSIFDLPITFFSQPTQLPNGYNLLANFIETDQNFRCGIRVVIITQNKKGRHNMLWFDFLLQN